MRDSEAARGAGTCTHRGCSGGRRDTYLTWPNLVTVVRTTVALALIVAAIGRGAPLLLYAGLAAHWVGDMADGLLARRTGTETRTGALLDVVADRVCVSAFFFAYLGTHHRMLVPGALFLLTYSLVDTMLSLGFLGWPLLSPNYFSLVHRRLYLLNWSPLAKTANATLLVVVMVTTGSWLACVILGAAQLAVKTYSTVLLARLRPSYGAGCARPAVEQPSTDQLNPVSA